MLFLYSDGNASTGSMIYYEIPGQINLSKLKENGLDLDALCRHYIYITEFLWNVSCGGFFGGGTGTASAGGGQTVRLFFVRHVMIRHASSVTQHLCSQLFSIFLDFFS